MQDIMVIFNIMIILFIICAVFMWLFLRGLESLFDSESETTLVIEYPFRGKARESEMRQHLIDAVKDNSNKWNYVYDHEDFIEKKIGQRRYLFCRYVNDKGEVMMYSFATHYKCRDLIEADGRKDSVFDWSQQRFDFFEQQWKKYLQIERI